MRDRKVFAFYKSKPADRALTALADALGGEWAEDGGLWTLRPEPKRRALELEAARAPSVRAAQAQVRAWQKAAIKDFVELHTDLRAMEDEAKRLGRERPNGWQNRLGDLSRQIDAASGVAGSGLRYLVASVTRGFDAQRWSDLWRGVPMVFVESRDIPARAPVWLAAHLGQDEPVAADALAFGVDPVTLRLEIRVWSAISDQPARMSERYDLAAADANLEATGALDDADLAWSRAQEGALPQTFPRMPAPIFPVGRTWTIGDVAESFALRSGAPVIGEAVRSPRRSGQDLYSATDTEAWLRLATEDAWRWADGWLRGRPRLSCVDRTGEPPELQIAGLEALPYPPIDLYAKVATASTPASEARFAARRVAGAFDPRPLTGAIPALRFWDALTPAEKTVALSGGAVPVSSMTSKQRALWFEALQKGVLLPGATLDFVRAYAGMSSPEALGFYLEQYVTVRQVATNGVQIIEAGATDDLENTLSGARDPRSWRVETLRQRELRFFFGLDARRSVQFSSKLDEAALSK